MPTLASACPLTLRLALVFCLVPAICNAQITELIDATGDGAGNPLSLPAGIAVDGSGAVYVGGRNSDNVFKIPADLTPVELLTLSIE